MSKRVALVSLDTGKSGLFINESLVVQFNKGETRAEEIATSIALALGADLRLHHAKEPEDPFWIWHDVTVGIPSFSGEEVTGSEKTLAPRVLITVKGGVANYVCDDGIDVEIFDWDDYEDDPDCTEIPPHHFADLVEGTDIPVHEPIVRKSSMRP